MSVLSAPTSLEEVHILSTAILVVSGLSAIGAGWIILSFTLFRPLRSFRHQLILGLAISDFCMAINFMSSAIVTVGGRNIGGKVEKPFCSFNGFMVQVFVIQTDYWVLTIAVYTYLILADHKHQSNWIHDHGLTVWVIPWFLSILWASIGLATVGYGDIGAWCWFVSDRLRLFVNFLPRWLIIMTILAMYTRLYFILHQSHNRFMSVTEDTTGTLQTFSSAAQHTQRLPFNVSSGANKNSGRGGQIQTTHTRLGKTSSVLKRISYQMMTYPLVYMLIWTTPTAIRIYQSITGKSAPFAIGTLDKCCIVIQGFADAIVYGFNEQTWRIWRGVLSKSDPK